MSELLEIGVTDLAHRVRQLRTSKGYTLEGLAGAIGAGKSYIWNIEHRKVKSVSGARLNRIAKVLGTTSEYLLGQCNNDTAQLDACWQKFRKLSEKDRRCILSLLDKWR